MKFWLTLVILILFGAPQAFAGETDANDPHSSIDRPSQTEEEKIVEGIRAVLSHFHEVPTRQQLEAVTEEARQYVFDIAGDEEAFLFHRQRAIRALAHWPDAEVKQFYEELLTDESTEEGLLFHVVPAAAEAFGEESLDLLTPLLREHENPHLRISAARAIASIPDDAGHDVLVEALHSEDNPIVQRRLERLGIRVR